MTKTLSKEAQSSSINKMGNVLQDLKITSLSCLIIIFIQMKDSLK